MVSTVLPLSHKNSLTNSNLILQEFMSADAPSFIKKACKDFERLKYYKKISVNGFETAQELTWENNARKYLQLFQTIISGKMR